MYQILVIRVKPVCSLNKLGQHLANISEDYLLPIVMNAMWVLCADIVPPAKACTAFECIFFMESDRQIATELEIADRVFTNIPREAFGTLKDGKPDFQTNPKMRLLNHTKME